MTKSNGESSMKHITTVIKSRSGPGTPMIVSSPSMSPVYSLHPSVKVPIFEQLLPRLLQCCYGSSWPVQMYGVIGLGALVGKVTIEKGWISWGNYCDMAFKETHDEILLEYTMNCFLQGIKFGIPTSRSHLAHVQYVISSDTPNEPVGGQTLEKKIVCFLSPSQLPPPTIHHLSRHLPPLSRYHSPPSRRQPPFSTATK
nr:transformation/transcription domain-associated protein-like [Tanacetum cinerariifolium]